VDEVRVGRAKAAERVEDGGGDRAAVWPEEDLCGGVSTLHAAVCRSLRQHCTALDEKEANCAPTWNKDRRLIREHVLRLFLGAIACRRIDVLEWKERERPDVPSDVHVRVYGRISISSVR
jgi:hypothetical protein